METNGHTTTTKRGENGGARLTPEDIARFFHDGYREIEILPDGTLRERTSLGDPVDESVTRTLKTERTWY